VVVLSSAFMDDCPPSSGTCLAEALGARYGQPFTVAETSMDPKYGNLGFVLGSRWVREDFVEKQVAAAGIEEVAVLKLKDSVTGKSLSLYAMHTGGGVTAMKEIEWAAGDSRSGFRSGEIAPVIGGDFNFTESDKDRIDLTEEGIQMRSTLLSNFEWANYDVQCPGVPGLPENTFRTQNGNVMHLFLGRIDTGQPKYAYPCAGATLEPIRMSYSVDAAGSLLPEAIAHGIRVDDIAHNVLAFGLRIKDRGPLPRQCDECRSRCESAHDGCMSACQKVPPAGSQQCRAACAQTKQSCLGRCG
jgi:hypothetical protein